MDPIEEDAIRLVRGFAMDAPRKANSGHPGTAMALAPLGEVLYGRVMRHDPSDPAWPARDRRSSGPWRSPRRVRRCP